MALAEAKQHRRAARRVTLRDRRTRLGLGGLAVSIIAASCGSATSTRTASAPASTDTANHVVISTAQNAVFGTILISGKTLYTLKPSQTACAAECLKIWPRVVLARGVTAATAGPGVSASKLGTVAGTGGVGQVTYSGQALYFFAKDTAAGQVNGNISDRWGIWSVVVTAGPVAASPSPSSAAPATSTTPPPTTATRGPTPTTAAPSSGGAGF
ncbi:MAG: hypothetical protein ACRDXE_03595 [Acidimicrobiales bacterium]